MSSPVVSEDFSDLESHKRMWAGFTHLMVRGVIALVIIVLFIGFVTGVL